MDAFNLRDEAFVLGADDGTVSVMLIVADDGTAAMVVIDMNELRAVVLEQLRQSATTAELLGMEEM
ncbi:hypothetical protein HY480_01795 [Candidatus Uhrbacteria bacterium]|nr:hypothetical protein [Candidatus Uhrbacteria bacterium]